MKFSDNINESNYYYFDEGNLTYVIIYPIDLRVDMITEKQLNYMLSFQSKDKIELMDQDRMYTFVTKKLAHLIIQRLEKGEEIRFAFSKQADKDTKEAYDNFVKACETIKNSKHK